MSASASGTSRRSLGLHVLTDISACCVRRRADGVPYTRVMHVLVAIDEPGGQHGGRPASRGLVDAIVCLDLALPVGLRLV